MKFQRGPRAGERERQKVKKEGERRGRGQEHFKRTGQVLAIINTSTVSLYRSLAAVR